MSSSIGVLASVPSSRDAAGVASTVSMVSSAATGHDAVPLAEQLVERPVGRQQLADVGEPFVVEVHGLDSHRFAVGVPDTFQPQHLGPLGQVELGGDIGLGVDDGDVDELRSRSAALRHHVLGVRRELQVLRHLGWSDERSSPLAAHDPPFDGEVVERLAHGGPGDVELLAQRPLGGDRCPRRQPVDVLAQPLPELVVLRLGDLRRPLRADGFDVAVDLDLDAAITVQGERLPAAHAIGPPAELRVEAASPLVVDDDPQRGEHETVGAQAAHRGVHQTAADAGADDVGVDVDREDVAGRPRVVVGVGARTEVDEPDDVAAGPSSERATSLGRRRDPRGPDRALAVGGRR